MNNIFKFLFLISLLSVYCNAAFEINQTYLDSNGAKSKINMFIDKKSKKMFYRGGDESESYYNYPDFQDIGEIFYINECGADVFVLIPNAVGINADKGGIYILDWNKYPIDMKCISKIKSVLKFNNHYLFTDSESLYVCKSRSENVFAVEDFDFIEGKLFGDVRISALTFSADKQSINIEYFDRELRSSFSTSINIQDFIVAVANKEAELKALEN